MEEIERGTDGAKYFKADLHVHTPGSHDYNADISAGELVDSFLDEGLDLVAVTDHDCAGMYEEIRKAAEDRSLEVLPGVEITTPQGGENQIHVTAIFPPEEHDAVNYVLGQIGINSERAGHQQADEKILRICQTIIDNDGLPILAHIDEAAGAHTETGPGQIRDEIFDSNRVAAIEVVDSEIRSEYSEFPAIKSSDAHGPDQLGRGYTFLKMTEPSFSGLRTALSDPDLRIAFEEPENDHPHIEGIRVNGEFLDGRAVCLNQNLNCLIGGKGTGKSTVIEHIRYAFDIEPHTERISNDYTELIDETLGPDGEVEVHVVTDDGQQYVVTRQYEVAPEITRVTNDGPESVEMDIGTFRDQFFGIEIHSQRELLELARDNRDQLELIDSYLDFGGAKRERENIKGKLRDNAQNLRSAREERDRLESETADYDAIQENLSVMEEQGVEDYLEGQEEWEQENRKFNRYISTIEDAAAAIDEVSLFDEELEDELEDSPNPELIETARTEVQEAISNVEELEEQILDRLQQAFEVVESSQEKWDDRFESRREEYDELADEIEEETGVDVDKYFDLKDRQSELAGVQEELEEKEERLSELDAERQRLLAELDDVRRQITDIRRQGLNEMDEELTDEVRVQLNPDSNREKYLEWFSDVLQGSRVRMQDKEAIAEKYDPEVLTRIIGRKNTNRLVDNVGITETAAENVVNHEDLRARIHELQTLEIHDRPLIEIRDEGEWKTLSQMSDGQQCTALLSIAMLERDRPLIIDQPEDMLDNEFIYDVVVDIIKRVKESRQILTATHNANIPILGDAEQMLVMSSNGRKGFFTNRGSIDIQDVQIKAQNILEGGKEAFNRRTRKYGGIE